MKILLWIMFFVIVFSFLSSVGLAADPLVFYNFLSLSHVAERANSTIEPPQSISFAGTEATVLEYPLLSSSNTARWPSSNMSGNWHRFTFKIDQNASNIRYINYFWEGRDRTSSVTTKMYVWNFTSSSWVFLDSSNLCIPSCNADFILTKTLAGENIGHVVNATNHTIFIIHNDNTSTQAVLETDFASVIVRVPSVILKDEVLEPCKTNFSSILERCSAFNITENVPFNITFHYVNATNTNGTINQTLNLKYASSRHPWTRLSDFIVPFTNNCTDRQVILKNVYTSCGTSLTCTNRSDGSVEMSQTIERSDYDANLTYEVQFCTGTSGRTFDIANRINVSTLISNEGFIRTNSFLKITPAVKPVWNFTTNSFVESSPATGNLNGDNLVDVVIGSDDFNVYALSNGSQLWSFPTGSDVLASPALADLNEDRLLDVVAANCNGRVFGLNSTNGAQLWNYTSNVSGCFGSSPAIANLTPGGTKYVFIGISETNETGFPGRLIALNGTNGSLLWFERFNGTVWASPALSDVITGDSGKPEVIIASHNSYVYVFNSTSGAINWSSSTSFAGATDIRIESSPAVGNIDGDSDREVVVGTFSGKVFALNGINGNQEWNFTAPAGTVFFSSPVIVDINNDSSTDVVINSNLGHIFALNGANGTQIWNYTISTGGRADSSPAIADVNDDTLNDVIFGASDGFVYALNGIDGTLIWNHSIGGYSSGSPAIMDLDGDGHLEIVVGSFNKRIDVIDPPGALLLSRDWSMFGGNPARTRTLDDEPPTSTFNVVETVGNSLRFSSLWTDTISNLVSATLIEDSSGLVNEVSTEIFGTTNWANFTITPLGLKLGDVIAYQIDVSDIYGNSNPLSGEFTITNDVFAPKVSILSPIRQVYFEKKIPLIFTINEPASRVSYSLDDGRNVTIKKNINTTITVAKAGFHNITIYATDTSGNTGSSNSVTFFVCVGNAVC